MALASTFVSHLVIDVGTSGIRTLVVRPDATITAEHYARMLPSSPFQGAVEFDAAAMADAVLDLARRSLAEAGPVKSVGITNQRASTIVWDRSTGEPVAPGVGWQDLRTAGMCLVLQAQGIRVAPNASATKLVYLLDLADPSRSRDLCFGTVDTWIAWQLSGGRLHVTDASNAAVTGLTRLAAGTGALEWDPDLLRALNIPASVLPSIIESCGVIGPAAVLDGEPPIAGIAGDQQSSLVGQGCVRPGLAKITFGTGGMLDVCVGPEQPAIIGRGDAGTFPIVAWQAGGRIVWGVEAIMLSAGTCVDWLHQDLGLITSPSDSATVAAACDATGDVWFVPALLGLGAPVWDYGARGTLLGLTRGTGRPEVVRAVLEGIAHRGADLVEAAEQDGRITIDTLRVDGGMTAYSVFLQAVADATQRPIEVSPVVEATALGAGFLAGVATGTWESIESLEGTWRPRMTIEPRPDRHHRERWLEARDRSRNWLPDLSALDF